MKHLSSIVLTAAVLAAGTVACFKDPTSSLRNGPTRIVLTRSSVFLNVGGDSLQVQAELKDEQGNTYDVADATWTSANPAVAVVNIDTSQYIPYKALTRAFIHTVSVAQTKVYVATHGLTDSIQVVGVPPLFTGTVTVAAGPMLGDTVTIASMNNVTWSGTSTVTYGGQDMWIVSQTPSQIVALAKVPAANGPITLGDLTLLGTVPLTSLATATQFATADTARYYWPANTTRAGAPVIDLTGKTPANPAIVYGAQNANSATYWNYWTFTLAAPAAVTGTITWFGDGSGSDNNNPDFDLIICGPAPVASCGYADDLAGNAAAGTNMPETFTTGTLAAGQYYLRTFAYSTAGFVLYQLKVGAQ